MTTEGPQERLSVWAASALLARGDPISDNSELARYCPPNKRIPMQWQFWIIQTLNSVAFGGLLFLLSSGFSLIFGLMRIPNLAHGAFFMLGAYFGYTLLQLRLQFWPAAIVGGLGVVLIGAVFERFVLRRLAGGSRTERSP